MILDLFGRPSSIPFNSLVQLTDIPLDSRRGVHDFDFALDPTNNRIFVVYNQSWAADTVGLFLDNGGNVIKTILVPSPSHGGWVSRVAFNPKTHMYLVAFNGAHGQLVSSDGTLFGTEIDLIGDPADFYFTYTSYIGYDEAAQKIFFVGVSSKFPSYGFLINDDGTVERPPYDLSPFKVALPGSSGYGVVATGGYAKIGHLFAWVPAGESNILGGFARFDTGIPLVTITAPDPIASEAGPSSGCFKISRTGSTESPLSVYYKISGTAKNKIDVLWISSKVTIPAAKSSTTIKIVPKKVAAKDGDKTLNLKLIPKKYYTVASPDNATITIKDDDE